MRISEKEKWKNIVGYIMASLLQEEDAESREEGKRINDEMYEWLVKNFKLSRKPVKPTIFGNNQLNKQP